MLQHADQLDRMAERPKKKRRRSSTLIEGKPPHEETLDVVVVESTGEPTTIFLGTHPESSSGITINAAQLEKLNAFVQKTLSRPPPVARPSRKR